MWLSFVTPFGMDSCSEAGAGGRTSRSRPAGVPGVLDSFEPDGFDMDLDARFEAGLGYLLDGFGIPK